MSKQTPIHRRFPGADAVYRIKLWWKDRGSVEMTGPIEEAAAALIEEATLSAHGGLSPEQRRVVARCRAELKALRVASQR